MKFLNNIDLQRNEIQNFRVQNLAAAPENPVIGQHYFNTVDATEYVWNGVKWIDALSQGDYTFENGIKEEGRHVSLTPATKDEIGGVIVGDNIDVEDGIISVKSGNKEQIGLLALATDEEAAAGQEDTKAVTAKQVAAAIDADLEPVIQSIADNKAAAEEAIAAVDAKADKNAEDIAKNAEAIAKNAEDIAKNAEDIIANKEAAEALIQANKEATDAVIEANKKAAEEAIAKNAEDIAKNAQDIADNKAAAEEAIAKNAQDIAKNTEDIAANAKAIADNKAEIDETLEQLGAANAEKVAELEQAIVDAKQEALDAVEAHEQAVDQAVADINAALETKVDKASLGVANGVATLDANGLVPAAQLPSYVDDIVELVAIGEKPAECAEGAKCYADGLIYVATAANTWDEGKAPETDKIYVNLANDMSYRWGGTTMVQIGADKLKGFNAQIIGDGQTTTFTLDHNLGTRNVVFEIYEAAAPFEKVYVQVLHTSLTSLQVVFSMPPQVGTDYNVTVIAIA